MPQERKQFTRETPGDRRDALIAATLSLIADEGIGAATVRAIARRAEVTPGLIRHYFSTKEALLSAAYARHMSDLTDATRRHGLAEGGAHADARARLAEFVRAGLRPPVVSARAVSLWAGFLTLVQRDSRMRETHAGTYRDFRDHLESLISDALAEAGRPASPEHLRELAIACNAVIDGLWLEGGVLPSEFGDGRPERIGLDSVGAILGLALADRASGERKRAALRPSDEQKERQ